MNNIEFGKTTDNVGNRRHIDLFSILKVLQFRSGTNQSGAIP